jgi:tetratricopeptide (TPR) repeat protein
MNPEDQAWPGLILSQRGVAYLNQFIANPSKSSLASKAEDDLQRAVDLCRAANKNALPMALHRYGRYYQAMKNYDHAATIFYEGYELSKLQQDQQFIIENLVNLCETLFFSWEQSGNEALVKEMEKYHAEIIELEQSNYIYPHLSAKMQQILANVLLTQNRYEEALHLYTESLPKLVAQEIFVGRDRLDQRLREIEPLIGHLPLEWQRTWWTRLYEVASRSGFSAHPDIIQYLETKYRAYTM